MPNMSYMPSPFSIVIPVKNEAANLAFCLESVVAFDDVIVVDSESTDGTRQIAEKYGREVVDFKWNGTFPKKRNWVLRTHTFKYPWVLFLDADERLTPLFVSEAARTLPTTPHNVFRIGYRNWFMGNLLRYGDPMRKTALVRIGHGEYERVLEEGWSPLDMEVHEQLVAEGSEGVIKRKVGTSRQKRSAYLLCSPQRLFNVGGEAVSGTDGRNPLDSASTIEVSDAHVADFPRDVLSDELSRKGRFYGWPCRILFCRW